MRVLHVVVPTDQHAEAREVLEEEQFTLVAIDLVDRGAVLLEIPVPGDAVGDVLNILQSRAVDVEEYTVIASAEAALTATSASLEEKYAGEYDPLTSVELRTKARDLCEDPGSYAVLMTLSAIIATAGLLLSSPAIVVGSMVIAPIIGPSLTAGAGVVTRDRKLLVDSLWMQLYGLGLAIAAAAAFAAALRYGGVVPTHLDLPSLDLFGVRLAPNVLSLSVGIVAGLAAGVGLTTKGPTSIIGVMIAAALIPTAAASGIAIAWLEPELAIGTAVLVGLTVILINLSVLGVLLVLGYRKRGRAPSPGELTHPIAYTVTLGIAVLLLTLLILGASAGQIAVDREIQRGVGQTLEDPQYENLTAVTVQTRYSDMSPFTGPRSVTVVVSQSGEAPIDSLPADLRGVIAERTGESVEVRIETIDYEVVRAEADTSELTEPAAVPRQTGGDGLME